MRNLNVALVTACAVVVGCGFTASADIPASAYVQDGLIVQWDGIDNAGTGTHDAEATAWKDLKGSLDLELTSKGSWVNGSALYVNGGCAAKAESATEPYKTIEVVYKMTSSSGRILFASGCVSGGKNRRWLLFDSVTGYQELYVDGCDNQIFAPVVFEADKIKSFAARYNGDIVSSVATNGLVIANPSKQSNSWNIGDGKAMIGDRSVSSSGYPWKGEVYSIRLYDRPLSDLELAVNATIDRIRFEGADPATVVWPEGSRYNAQKGAVEIAVTGNVEGVGGTVRVGDGTASPYWAGLSEGVTVTAVPAAGYKFFRWKFDMPSDNATITVSAARATTLVAQFLPETAEGYWVYTLASGKTDQGILANPVTGSSFNAGDRTVNGVKGLQFKTVICTDGIVNGSKTVDFTLPVLSPDGQTEYQIISFIEGVFTNAKSGLENVYLPDTLLEFGRAGLDSLPDLVRVRLPANTTRLSSYLFCRSCPKLVEVLPQGILESGQIVDYEMGAFRYCSSLTNVPCLTSVTNLRNWVFQGCSSIAGDPQLRDLQVIGESALSGCSKMTFPDPLVLSKVETIGVQAFNGTALARLDLRNAPITALDLQYAASVTNVMPQMPPTLTSIHCYSAKTLAGDVKLSNPGMTALPPNGFRDTLVTSVDLSGTSIADDLGGSLFSSKTILKLVLPKAFSAFPSVDTLFNTGADSLKWIYFRGDPPTVKKNPLSAAIKNCSVMVPRWNATWTDYLADSSACTVAEMTAGDVTAFRASHPGEPVPAQTVKLDNVIQATYVGYWTPDEPTPQSGEVSYRDVLAYEGGAATLSDPLLFDGTTRALGAADLMWTGLKGQEVTFVFPEGCNRTRGLKLKRYEIHQMSAGEHPNVRAPTAWKLYGRTGDAAEWELIDERTLTAGSSPTWRYFGEDTTAVPDRAEASLSFAVSADRQKGYAGFKFVPVESMTDSVGLCEIEFFGEVASPDPVIESFSAFAGWKCATFTGQILSAGEDVAHQSEAEWARGRVELSLTEDFAQIAATSAEVAMTAGSPTPFAVDGLAAGTAYYARLVVENSLGGTAVRPIDGTVVTLDVPWQVAGGVLPPPVRTTTPAGATSASVRVPVEQLFADSVVAKLYYATSLAGFGDEPLQAKVAQTVGEIVFDPFVSTDEVGFFRVVISGTADGEPYEKAYWTALGETWVADAETPTSISNTLWGATLLCKADGANLTLTAIDSSGRGTVVNLCAPICTPQGVRKSVTKIGTVFGNNKILTELYLPDTVTSFDTDAISAFSIGSQSVLRKVRLPNTLQTLSYVSMRSLVSLQDVENLLPTNCNTLGRLAMQNCSSVTNDLHFYRPIVKVEVNTSSPDSPFSGVSRVKRCYFHDGPFECDINTILFGSMTDLIFYVPYENEDWKTFLEEKCEMRALEAADRTAFRSAYPGERMAKAMVKIPAGAAKWRYLKYWYPDGRTPGLVIFVR